MNYDIHIENLGAIKKANITITPLTILAGENGTGKSFVTKFLYSVLNVINTDIYSDKTTKKISQIISLIDKITNHDEVYLDQIDLDKLDSLKNMLSDLKIIINEEDFSTLEIVDYTSVIDEIREYSAVFENGITSKRNVDKKSPNKSDTTKKVLLNSIKLRNDLDDIYFSLEIKKAPSKLEDIIQCLKNPNQSYIEFTKEALQNELKENFQISELKDIINFGQNECVFKIHKLINITININNDINVDFDRKYFEKIVQINRLVFFESPVYWRLLTLIKEDERSYIRLLSKEVSDEKLSGVPKHFLDLKELLFANFKDGERPKFVVECANSLKKHLKGNFEPNNNDLVFQNLEGHNVSKSLVSFGMTNIGIIQAVLSKNIISKGAFIFIDEPESNLHPSWQSMLSEVLLKLSMNGVYVIITTHSSDMLKALEFNANNNTSSETTDFISTNYFNNENGTLLELEGSNPLKKIASARVELLKPYNALSIKKSLFDA